MGKATQPNLGFKQVIYSEPQFLAMPYLTKKGERLLITKAMPVADIWAKYGKNRYVLNPYAVPVKVIYHPKLDKFGKLVSYHG